MDIKNDQHKSLYKQSLSLIKDERYEEALKILDKAIALNPDYADAWYSKGLTLLKLGREEEALKVYHKVIKLNPDYARAWYYATASWKQEKNK